MEEVFRLYGDERDPIVQDGRWTMGLLEMWCAAMF